MKMLTTQKEGRQSVVIETAEEETAPKIVVPDLEFRKTRDNIQPYHFAGYLRYLFLLSTYRNVYTVKEDTDVLNTSFYLYTSFTYFFSMQIRSNLNTNFGHYLHNVCLTRLLFFRNHF